MYFGPEDEDAFFAFRDPLVEDLASWPESALPGDSSDLGLLLDWKWGYGDGQIDRWQLADLEEFLLDWCPRKLTVPPGLAADIPAGVANAVRFLAARGLLGRGSAGVEQLAAYAIGQTDAFLAAMTDPANFGMAKSLFGSMGIDDPISLAPPPQPTVGPVLLPDPEVVRAGADASPLLAGFDILSDYFAAPGKNLTAAGNLTMADARTLVGLLGTDESEEVAVGDVTFRKRSATRFPQLDHWQWWARQAGVLRQQGRKLVAVKAWRERRRRDPLLVLRRAVDVLLEYGPLASSRPGLSGVVEQLLDAGGGPVLGALLNRPEGIDFDETVEMWTDLVALAGYEPWYPGHVANALDATLTLFERLGLVEQFGVESATSEYGVVRRTGGQIRLTPLGIALAAALVADQGVEVLTVPAAAELTAEALAALADSVNPAAWWSAAATWLASQADPSAALGALIERVADDDPGALLVLLNEVPASLQELLVPLATRLARRSSAITDELAVIAFNWLLLIDRLDPADADHDRAFDASLVTYGILVEADSDVVDALVDDSLDRATHLAVLAAAGSRTSPRVLAVLEAIGNRHDDKVVAKAARKEAFRMRSRLAG